jgi:hypothetical protein
MDQVLSGFYVYSAVGVVVALAFLLWGIDRVDEAARGAWLVRPQLAPGMILLWPLVLARWIVLERRKAAKQ